LEKCDDDEQEIPYIVKAVKSSQGREHTIAYVEYPVAVNRTRLAPMKVKAIALWNYEKQEVF
jgi:hypothetical protein